MKKWCPPVTSQVRGGLFREFSDFFQTGIEAGVALWSALRRGGNEAVVVAGAAGGGVGVGGGAGAAGVQRLEGGPGGEVAAALEEVGGAGIGLGNAEEEAAVGLERDG